MNDILIAGGGLAGATAATALAQAGREVTLIERAATPAHKICGEFLSAEAQASLSRIGFDCARLGGQRITHVRLSRGTRSIIARLPFEGLGITRKTLDEALLQHAAQAGVNILRGHAIRAIDFTTANSKAGFRLELDRATPRAAATLFLATGKHDARGIPRPGRPSRLVGFKTYFQLSPAQHQALAGQVEIFMFSGGYAGMQLVETGEANLCFLAEPALLARAAGKFPALLDLLCALCPQLGQRLAGAVATLPAPLTIARVPYGFVYRPDRRAPPGLFRLGDQAAVIPSFTGDGMAIALHSAGLAADFHLHGATSHAYHHRLARDVRFQIHRAGALYTAARLPPLAACFFAAARLIPQILPLCASLTRVPTAARLEFST